MPESPAFVYDTEYAGRSCTGKITSIRTELKKKGAESVMLSASDEIAWTLSLCGNDVHCNPVVISYLLITEDSTILFITPEKVTEEVRNYLKEQQVEIRNYTKTEIYLSDLKSTSILMNPAKTSYAILSSVNPRCRIMRGEAPVALLKVVHNNQEIAGVHIVIQRDGVALVRFLKWLESAVPSEVETELSIDHKLHEFRAAQSLYVGESFDTVAGYKERGAVVHYSATGESNATLQPKDFLLLDSGAQYMDGTTDITRTIALGELTEEEKIDYILALKGYIALAMVVFPAGAREAQLDVLARMPLWSYKMNFLHGTDRGVGHFFSVHEGPQSIRMNENPVILQPGMVTSNEPGAYKGGSHGIRVENLTLVCKAGESLFGEYLRFETITLCPIYKRGIIKELLTAEETDRLNDYHRQVYEKLSPGLNGEERIWLKEATAAIRQTKEGTAFIGHQNHY